jgi:AcrR family transcriptional regulator
MTKNLAPKQARSKKSLKRLLKGTAEVLNEKGLKGATIPRIAARAELSPAALYRRFPDKEALLREVFFRIMEKNEERTRSSLTPELARSSSLKFFIDLLIRNSLISHRRHAGLLRAMHQFVSEDANLPFRKKFEEIESKTIQTVANFLLHYRLEIKHPDPEGALTFALLSLGIVLREIVLERPVTESWASLLPKSDDQLVPELTRMTLGYLGVESR